jgi:Lrp/AsnC family leucine-responsive transcriptional regulator
VRQLETEGIITGYTALLDRRAVGCSYEAFIWVSLDPVTRDSMTEFEDAVAGFDAITEVHRMMGQPDYFLRVVAADAEHFETIYIDQLAKLPRVKTLTSQIAMKVVKRTHLLPLAPR